jgi:hypothetical protein
VACFGLDHGAWRTSPRGKEESGCSVRCCSASSRPFDVKGTPQKKQLWLPKFLLIWCIPLPERKHKARFRSIAPEAVGAESQPATCLIEMGARPQGSWRGYGGLVGGVCWLVAWLRRAFVSLSCPMKSPAWSSLRCRCALFAVASCTAPGHRGSINSWRFLIVA